MARVGLSPGHRRNGQESSSDPSTLFSQNIVCRARVPLFKAFNAAPAKARQRRTVSITSTCIPSCVRYVRNEGGGSDISRPVPSSNISATVPTKNETPEKTITRAIHSPGFGMTTSNTSACSFVHFAASGTSHKKTFPSRNIHAEGITSPSASCIPRSVMDATWTGGAVPSAKMLLSVKRLEAAFEFDRAVVLLYGKCKRGVDVYLEG